MAFTDSLSLPQKVMVTCLASCCKYLISLQSHKHVLFLKCKLWLPSLCQIEPSMLCYNYMLVCCEYLCYCLSPEVLVWLQYHSQKFRVCSLALENNRSCKYTSNWRALVVTALHFAAWIALLTGQSCNDSIERVCVLSSVGQWPCNNIVLLTSSAWVTEKRLSPELILSHRQCNKVLYKFSASTVFPCHTSYLWERGEETGERDRVWYRHLLAHFWVAGDMLEEVREICHPLEQTSSFYRLLKWLEAVCSVFYGERKRKQLQQTWWFTSCPRHCFWQVVSLGTGKEC